MIKIKLKRKLIPSGFVGFLIFSLCFQNTYIGSIWPRILTFQAYGRLLALAICWVCMAIQHTNLLKSKVCIWTYCLVVVNLLSTALNGGNLIACINTFVPLLLIISVLELNKLKEDSLANILNIWKWLCVVITVIDIITELKFPEGLYSTALYTEYWFLGYKTERFIYIFPMLVIFGYINLKKSKRLNWDFGLSFILGGISCYLSGATTCWVTMIVLIVFYVILHFLLGNKASLRKQRLLYRLADYRVGIILYIVILICVLMAERIQIVVDITKMLGKDPTFSRRSLIWIRLIQEILKKPILGLGYMSSLQYSSMVSYAGGTNAHNMVLTMLVYGGCIGLLVYLIIFSGCLRRKNKEYSLIELFLIAGVYSFLIAGVTSSIMVYSSFGFILYWLLEYEKESDRSYAKSNLKKNIFTNK